MKGKIFYLLFLLEGLFLIMLYDFRGLRFLFCCLVLLPLLSFLLLIPMAFCCSVSIKASRQTVVREETAQFRLVVENKGLLPVSGLSVRVRWSAPGEKEGKAWKRLSGLGRGAREEIVLEFAAAHCGRARLRVARARLYDYFGIFSLPVKVRGRSLDVCVYPMASPVAREAMALDFKEMGKDREGDMFLRGYLPGDSLRRIYWQLSAKTEELQVRDFEKSGLLRVFLDFSPAYRKQCGEWDRYLDRLSSLLFFLLEEAGGDMFWMEAVWRQAGRLYTYDISDMAALYIWLGAILAEEPLGTPFGGGEDAIGEALCLREDCGLYIGEQCIYG